MKLSDLERRAAGLVMTSYSGRSLNHRGRGGERRRLINEVAELGAAGFCVFGGTVDSVRELVTELEPLAGRKPLVASDLERGLGQQLAGGTAFPSQMAIGATGDPSRAREVGRATALEARSAGIGLVFAPVADVLTEPRNPIVGVRAYGSDAGEVARFVTAFVEGCQGEGVAATAKHFPGHGATALDSHVALPVVEADATVLDARELVPFRAAVAAGVRAVMVGHIAFPGVTGSRVPATFSPSLVEGLLRKRIGFEGVVVTDALMMGAITEEFGPREAAVAALKAGCDLLLMPPEPSAAARAVAAAVTSGSITEEQLERSRERIGALLEWIGRAPSPGATETREHASLAESIAGEAVTVVRSGSGFPLRMAEANSDRVLLVALVDAERPADVAPLRKALASRLPGTELSVLGERAADAELHRCLREASAADITVVFVFDEVAAWRGRAWPSEEVVSMARALVSRSRRTVVVAFTTPFLAARLPESAAFLCCYDTSPPMQRAGVRALFGAHSLE